MRPLSKVAHARRWKLGGAAAMLVFAVAACSSSATAVPSIPLTTIQPASVAPASTAPSPELTQSPAPGNGASGGYGAYGGGAAATTQPASSAAAGGSASSNVVKTATDSKLGSFLVGEDGRTLYMYKPDSTNQSVCTGGCATAWPPFTLANGETPTAGPGVTGKLATFARSDGSMQVSYNGVPLYYFQQDKKAGDVTGQGLGGVWFVVKP
jgi:predicted lipoprotein with Yx(FWY)xxD motif